MSMNAGKTLFAQLMDFLPWTTFARIVERHHGDAYIKKLNAAEHFRVMAFAQLTHRESLRDIEACLSAQPAKLYHMGFRHAIKRATLAEAAERRDWRIYADFAQSLITQARKLYLGDSFDVELENTTYALDSSTIDLCLTLFPWVPFCQTKSAVKMHTLLDLRGSIPSFIHISDAKSSDVAILDDLVFEAGAIYVMDRGYVDFGRLYKIHQAGAFFVTRSLSNTQFRRVYSAKVDRSRGIVCDQTIMLTGKTSQYRYSVQLRRIKFIVPETGKPLVFLTNNFVLSAVTICALYKARWRVELFFKWMKQHLRIKKFYGYSENAVKSQIWIAVSVYVLIAIVKKRLNLQVSIYTLLQVFSVSLFEKCLVQELFDYSSPSHPDNSLCNQLNLFTI
jgi:Domain of unknown function (DUF4372)/Transposase DDE domain